MNKQEFLEAMKNGLSGLPQEDIDRSVDFYEEMIDDHMEEEMTEEEAVEAIGPVNEIVQQILSEVPLTKLVKAKASRNWSPWEIVLLVLGSPIWLSLLLAAGAVILAVYIVLWSVVLVLYTVDISFALIGVLGIIGSLLYAFVLGGGLPGAMMFVGTGLIFSGLALLLISGSGQITRGMVYVSKRLFQCIKMPFIKKGETL